MCIGTLAYLKLLSDDKHTMVARRGSNEVKRSISTTKQRSLLTGKVNFTGVDTSLRESTVLELIEMT